MGLLWHRKIRYSHTKTIRLLADGTVERKYRRGSETIWKQVDCYLLSPRENPRQCPKGYRARLLRTAI